MTNNITRSGSLQLRKAAPKYYRREGTPGNYRYYYTEAEYKQAKGGKKPEEKKDVRDDPVFMKKYNEAHDEWVSLAHERRGTKNPQKRKALLDKEMKAHEKVKELSKKFEFPKSQSDSDINKAITPLETIKYAQQVVNEAEQVKTAEGRLHESIEHTVGYTWSGCLERVFTTGEMPPEGNYPYPRGFYDAGSRGANGSIGDFSEEELLYKTLDLTAIKVYVDIMRRGNTHDKDLLEGIKKVKFNPEYVKKVILGSDEVLEEIRRGIKGHIGRLLAGEGSSRAGYMMSAQDNDLQKASPPVRAGSAQLRKT